MANFGSSYNQYDIPNLTQTQCIDLASGDLLEVWKQFYGEVRRVSLADLVCFISQNSSVRDDKITQYAAPNANDFVIPITPQNNSVWLILTPNASYLLGTIVFPPSTYCFDRQEILMNCTQLIGTLVINGSGANVVGAPASIGINGHLLFRYDKLTNTWYLVG
jgi:hypothetical protein